MPSTRSVPEGSPDRTFAAALAEGFGFTGETWLYTFGTDEHTLSRTFLMTVPPEGSIVQAIRRTRYTSDGGIVRCGLSRYPGPTTKAYPVRIDELGQIPWTSEHGPIGQGN
jgi:hypothetical protein